MKTRLDFVNLIFCFLLLTFISRELYGTIRYVSKTGSSIPPYTSWATAADSIQKCINISEDEDTIYIANGLYYETLEVNKILTIIGSSMDSTIIDGRYSSAQRVISAAKHFNISNVFIRNDFNIENRGGIVYIETTGNVNNCRFEGFRDFGGVHLLVSSVNISNCFFRDVSRGIYLLCIEDTCEVSCYNNVIYSRIAFPAAGFPYGGSVTFINNIIIEEDETIEGVHAYVKEITAIGNLVANYKRYGFVASSTIGNGNLYFFNNTVSNIYSITGEAYGIGGNPNTILKNNIATKSTRGFSISYSPNVTVDYNLIWDVSTPIYGSVPLGDSNLINIDPMFVKDTIPVYGGSWDYHLQAYSPAIDKGDPAILDADGSRSDIGMYGGPFGEIYTYQDIAPRQPRNLTAVVDSGGRILLNWNKNTEADTSHYNIYRSTTSNFIIDSTKLIGSTKDTSFIDTYLPLYERLYYKITCVDRQDNQSQPSEELLVNLTLIDEYPQIVNDYFLYQNYPNPFNPTTKIGYKLKDRGYVKLMVYNIKGERIAVLVNQQQEPGYYEVEFNGVNLAPSVEQTNIASGIYLYRIEVIGEGNIPVYTEMRKMMLLK